MSPLSASRNELTTQGRHAVIVVPGVVKTLINVNADYRHCAKRTRRRILRGSWISHTKEERERTEE